MDPDSERLVSRCRPLSPAMEEDVVAVGNPAEVVPVPAKMAARSRFDPPTADVVVTAAAELLTGAPPFFLSASSSISSS